MQLTPDFIQGVNEIYHDLEQAEYTDRHPEIFQEEAARWRRFAELYLTRHNGSISVLDIGSGTGFVPMQVGPWLRPDDRLVCTDVSAEMLKACERSLSEAHLPCKVEYLKLEGTSVPLEPATFDCITVNSVLHHLPDIGSFFREADRLAKPGGRLIIAHEPNRAFFNHRGLAATYWLAALVLSPSRFVVDLLMKLRLFGVACGLLAGVHPKFRRQKALLARVNAQLMDRGLAAKPLPAAELMGIVDIHSPTAGAFRTERGFDVHEMTRSDLPGWQVEELQTYDHLGKIPTTSSLAKRYDRFLRRRYPASGSRFAVVLRKDG